MGQGSSFRSNTNQDSPAKNAFPNTSALLVRVGSNNSRAVSKWMCFSWLILTKVEKNQLLQFLHLIALSTSMHLHRMTSLFTNYKMKGKGICQYLSAPVEIFGPQLFSLLFCVLTAAFLATFHPNQPAAPGIFLLPKQPPSLRHS